MNEERVCGLCVGLAEAFFFFPWLYLIPPKIVYYVSDGGVSAAAAAAAIAVHIVYIFALHIASVSFLSEFQYCTFYIRNVWIFAVAHHLCILCYTRIHFAQDERHQSLFKMNPLMYTLYLCTQYFNHFEILIMKPMHTHIHRAYACLRLDFRPIAFLFINC